MKIGGIPGDEKDNGIAVDDGKDSSPRNRPGGILRQPVAEFGEGLSADLQRPVEEIEGQS
jgi:hypothetical protein